MVFVKGQSGNPAGRQSGYQNFVDRCKYLMDQHDIGDIVSITKDWKRFKKLSPYDGMIMRRIVEAVDINGNGSMNSLLDRIIGKPVQPVEQKTDVTITVALQEKQAEAFGTMDQIFNTIDHDPTKLIEHTNQDVVLSAQSISSNEPQPIETK